MKFSDITHLTKDDILGAVGLATKQSTTAAVLESLAIFSVGVLVGASAALLMAPKPGRELREELTARLRRSGADGEEAQA